MNPSELPPPARCAELLKAIRSSELTQLAIHQATGFCPATVNDYLTEFVQQGIVVVVPDAAPRRRGRPARRYRLAPEWGGAGVQTGAAA